MARLFISYRREDGTAFADRVAKDLQPPHEVWVDRREIKGGTTWAREIEEGITWCDAFLAIWTNGYNESKVIDIELDTAFDMDKRIIPLRIHAEAKKHPMIRALHYIDFADPAPYEKGLRELMESIAELNAPKAAAPAPAALDWAALSAHAAKQARGFVDDRQKRTFSEELYVRRTAAETELARFLGSAGPELVIVGDSGVGKTNLLCRWTLDLVTEGHAVLAYDCSMVPASDIEKEIVRDVGGDLEHANAEAARAGRKVVLIFDSIGDYRGEGGMQVLLGRIDQLSSRAGENVRVVMSCNTAPWNRMQRAAAIQVSELRLGAFTAEEFDSAYPRYQKVFNLRSSLDELPPAVRERLREPVLLRMTAETYRDAKTPLLPVHLSVEIYKRFFDARVQTNAEITFIDRLAELMLSRQTSALSIPEIGRDNLLGPMVLSDDPSSAYNSLVDRGVLREVRADVRAGVVKFAHTRIAAYALARHLFDRQVDITETVRSLAEQNVKFPLAWDVARTLLLLSEDRGAFVALAASHDVEERELATEALVELHAENAKLAGELLQALVDSESEASRRTALKAAYNIGPQMRDFFLHAAIDGKPSMRESLKNTLYLIWRNESPAGRRSLTDTLYLIWRYSPNFTYEFLNSLLGQLTLKNLRKFPNILEFILDLTITIYVNHCEEEDVVEKTAALLHKLSIEHLHLNLFNTGLFGEKFEKIVFRAVARVFGQPILDFMLFADRMPVKTFFEEPAERRAQLGRIADVFDPASDLAAAHDDLLAMLQSRTPVYCGSATLAIAVHATHDLARTEPLLRKLWDEVDAEGRLWIMMGFSVLLNATPPEWVPLLEDLTRRYVTEHRDAFLSDASRLAGNLDLVLLPLGLAYGKQQLPMTLFATLFTEAMEKKDTALASRIIAALGSVGFYYPHSMFEVLKPAMAHLGDETISNALVTTLATVRTLHFDAVDQFLDRTDAPDAFRHQIDAAADVDLVHRYIRVLGYYNNSIHFTLRYPRMRKPLSAGALKLLAEAKDAPQFVADYTMTAMRMLREANYQVRQWTLPE